MGLIFNGNGDVIKAVDGSLTVEGLDLDSSSTNINAGIVTGTSANFTGNVSVGGVLTYEDVKNVDSVGIVTAREGVFIPDNKKLQLGNAAGSADLEIFHDGSHSYVKDTGTGDLVLQGTNNVWLQHGNGENALKATQDAGVELRFNNSKKLETTSSGATVTGTIIGNNLTLSDNDPELTFTDLNNNPDYRIKAESGNLSFEDTTNGNVARLRINADGHVDVTGNLDVGAGVDITGDVTMTNTSSNPQLALISANNGISEIQFGDGADAVRGNIIYRAGSAGDALCFNGYNNTERMRIDSNGDINLGNNPTNQYGYKLNIQDSAILYAQTASSSGTELKLYLDHSNTIANFGTVSTSHLAFVTANTERLRIDSSGHMGLGITPSDIDSIGRALNIASSTGGAIYLQDTDSPTVKFGAISYNGVTAALQIHAHHGSSYIDLGTNGTERLRIQSDGTVRFYNSIYGGDNKPIYLGNSNDLSLFHDSGGSSIIRYNHNVGGLHFRNNSNADQMVINTTGGVGIGTNNFAGDLDNRPGLAIHSDHNDSCRLLITTPTKSPTRLGYFGLNRFGIDVHSGFEIRDVAASYATRFKIDNTGNVTKPNQPNFLTHAVNSDGSQNSNNLLNIGNTYHNIGSHYNTSNGRFTCPAAGIYFFYCMWTPDNSTSAPVIYFYVNGSQSQNGALNYNSQYAGTYMGQCISLSANDYVQCSMRDWNSSTPSPWQTWWGGYLLQ